MRKNVEITNSLTATVRKLSDENAGLLFKHIIDYMEGLDTPPPNEIIDIVFEPIKQSLGKPQSKTFKREERASVIERTEKWYGFEIQNNKMGREINAYKKFVGGLFGKSDAGIINEPALRLKDQVTYPQFEKLIVKWRELPEGAQPFSAMIMSMYNEPKYLKGKKSLYLTLDSWLNRARRR